MSLLMTPEMQALLDRFAADPSLSRENAVLAYEMIALSRREGLFEAAEFLGKTVTQLGERSKAAEEPSIRALLGIQANAFKAIVIAIEKIAKEHECVSSGILLAMQAALAEGGEIDVALASEKLRIG